MFKFLRPDGCTVYRAEDPFKYNLPRRSEKWSAPTRHPGPTRPDGKACGPGRLHLMKHLSARYAGKVWRVWWARGVGKEIGSDNQKAAYEGVQLRRILPRVLARALCPPFGWGAGADLHGINLNNADLHRATFRGANLREARFYKSNLRDADLFASDLRRANLRGADLRNADLRGADLCGADLCGADMRGANLRGADLRGANLHGADLCMVDFLGANLRGVRGYSTKEGSQ